MPDFKIGGDVATPPDASYLDLPGAKVTTEGGPLANNCSWTLEISVAATTLPVPGRPNCLYHFYRIRTTLTKVCPGKSTPVSETRVSRTGPHCADPPVPAPQPTNATAFKGSKKPDKGPEETNLELPDGTKVTVTVPGRAPPSVRLDYPSGTPTTLTTPPD